MDTNLSMQYGLEALERSVEALEALNNLKTITAPTSDEKTLRMALMTLEDITDQYGLTHSTISLEEGDTKKSFMQKVDSLMQEAWNALVRFLKWLNNLIDEFIHNSGLRTRSVTAGFENTRTLFNEARKTGVFKAPKAGRLNNQRIVKRLGINNKIDFNTIMAGVGFLNILTDKLERYLNQEIKKLSSFSITAVVTNIEEGKEYELPILSLFEATRQRVSDEELAKRGFNTSLTAYQSRVLLGNKKFFFVYSEDEDIKTFSNSKHGLYFTDNEVKDEIAHSPDLSVFETLTEHEMFQLVMTTQGFVNTVKQNETVFKEIRRAINKLISDFSRVKGSEIKEAEIDQIKNSVIVSCRSLGVTSTEYKKYTLNTIESISSYIRMSMEKYK